MPVTLLLTGRCLCSHLLPLLSSSVLPARTFPPRGLGSHPLSFTQRHCSSNFSFSSLLFPYLPDHFHLYTNMLCASYLKRKNKNKTKSLSCFLISGYYSIFFYPLEQILKESYVLAVSSFSSPILSCTTPVRPSPLPLPPWATEPSFQGHLHLCVAKSALAPHCT